MPFKAGLTVLSVQFFSMTIIFTQPISNNYKNSQKAVYMMHGLRTVRNTVHFFNKVNNKNSPKMMNYSQKYIVFVLYE